MDTITDTDRDMDINTDTDADTDWDTDMELANFCQVSIRHNNPPGHHMDYLSHITAQVPTDLYTYRYADYQKFIPLLGLLSKRGVSGIVQ